MNEITECTICGALTGRRFAKYCTECRKPRLHQITSGKKKYHFTPQMNDMITDFYINRYNEGPAKH